MDMDVVGVATIRLLGLPVVVKEINVSYVGSGNNSSILIARRTTL